MVDYTKSTGTSGTLIIRYDGEWVSFHIKNTQGGTFAYGKSWSVTMNGVSVSGTFDISGAQTVQVGRWRVSSSQTVSFTMGSTGTSGLGGPTSFSRFIDRSTAPGAGKTPTITSVSGTGVSFSWSASSDGGDSIDDYQWVVELPSGSDVTSGYTGSGSKRNASASGLSDGTEYTVRVRAYNKNGTTPWASNPNTRSFWTLPGAPSSLVVARVSDSQHTLSWTRGSTYTGVLIDRRTNGGSWQRVASPSGNLSSFTDTNTQAGRKYEYRVAGKNASGSSGWSNIVTVYTTPAVPSAPSAVRTGADDIRVSVSMGGFGTHLDIQDETTTVVSALAEGSLPWTHVNPNPATPHRYRARARVASGGSGSTTLYSAWSGYSNTVQLLSAPNAPVSLSPNGGVAASDSDVVFAWVHNPVDSSPQSAFEMHYREPGGAWTLVSGTTAETVSVALPVGAVEWEVRTKGAHPDWSPWSATAVFEVIDRPGVAIIQPGTVWTASTVPVVWTFFQAQSHPQSGWQLELLSEGVVVESRQGDGPTTEVTLNSRLGEGAYQLRVRAATGDVWSDWTEASFSVEFIPPADPVVAGVWDESQGGVLLTVPSSEYGSAFLDESGAWYTEAGA